MATVGSSKRHLNITSDSSAAATTMTLGGNGVATEAYVGTQITNLIDSSPAALNTLNELAAALGDDASFSTTVTNSIATKLALAGGTLTGTLTGTYGIFGNHLYVNQSANLTSQALQVNGFIDITDISSTALRWYNGSTFRGGLGTNAWAMSGSDSDLAMYISGDNSFFVQTNNVTRAEFDSSGLAVTGNVAVSGDLTVTGTDIRTGSNGQLSLGDDSSVLSIGRGNEMWTQNSLNAAATLYVNYRGYNGGSTQFRSLDIRDGKAGQIANFNGSDKSVSFAGNVSVTGTIGASNFSGSSSGTNTGDQTLPTLSSLGALSTSGGTMTGALTITHNPGDGLILQSATDVTTPVGITFTSQGTSATQKGHIRYNHRDSLSYGSAESFTIGGTETTTTILADGKLMYAEGIYSKPSSGTAAGTRKDANWDTAYGWGNHASAGYLTSLPSHNHDDRYYTETEINTKYTTTDGSGDEWKFTLGDESSLSGNKWYKVATINQGSGGLHIKGSFSNHVESFGTQHVDLLLQGREGNSGDEIEITGRVDVLNNATTGTDKVGIRVIEADTSSSPNYHYYDVYMRTTRYTQAEFHLTKFGMSSFHTSKPSVTSEPAPVSGGNVELDTSSLAEGNYVVDDSTPREIYHEGHKPTYTELGTMAYTNLTGTPTIPTNNNQLTNGAGYLTSETFGSSDVVMSLSGNDITAGASITLAGGLSFNASTNTLSQTDSDTVYTHPTSAGNKHIPTGGAAGQFLKYSSSGTAVWATPSYTTNTDTTYSAGGGLDLTSTTFSVEPDLRDGITHVGKDANNYIQFDSTNGRIDFYAGGVFVARMESDGDLHIKGDVIAFSDIFS